MTQTPDQPRLADAIAAANAAHNDLERARQKVENAQAALQDAVTALAAAQHRAQEAMNDVHAAHQREYPDENDTTDLLRDI